ncbi:MAG TPA: hypothetical protein PKA00_18360 [Saprospiraceae bacterium]|nr:hypothetical protein [Saprospiraceae bacterium]HMQ84882.1 hypothetical protein [Saprospiraceae bacterium]
MKKLLFLLLVLSSFSTTQAQKGLEGNWEGKITFGGLDGQEQYRFELVLEVKDRSIKGRSYIYISEDSIIYRELSGKIYEDNSVSLKEVFLEDPNGEKRVNSDSVGNYGRKYQFVYERSIWESTLNGYWQEVIVLPFHARREMGRIYLEKKKPGKA